MKKSQKSSKNSLTAKLVSSLLAEAKFNPREKGENKILADVGSSEYYEIQASLLIAQAQRVRGMMNNAPSEEQKIVFRAEYHAKMNESIKMLVLARYCESV